MALKIFITGGTGQVGQALAEALSGEKLLLGKRPEYDITDEKIIDKICDFQPDVVIHTAAYTDVDGCEKNPELAHQVNAVGTLLVASAAEKCRARLIYLSTDYVFSGDKTDPYIETDNTGPLNVYGRSKLEGERFVQQSCPRHVILRTSWVYGHSGKNFVKTILRKTVRHGGPFHDGEKELRVVNDQIGCPTYAKDLALAIAAIIKREAYGIFHAAGQGYCSWYEFAEEILRLSGVRNRLMPIHSEELDRPARRPRNSVLSQKKLNDLGIHLRPWKEALGEFVPRELTLI